jgi:hypothetical protein
MKIITRKQSAQLKKKSLKKAEAKSFLASGITVLLL